MTFAIKKNWKKNIMITEKFLYEKCTTFYLLFDIFRVII